MSLAFWVIILLAAAIFFGVLEIFVPSMGLLSVMAIISLIAAIVVAFELNAVIGFGVLVLLMIFGPIIVIFAMRLIPKTPFGKRVFLETELQSPEEIDPLREELLRLIGTTGRAVSLMMPSGKVVFAGKTYEAVSDAGAIDPKTAVVAVRAEGISLIVRPLLSDDSDSTPASDKKESAATADSLQPDSSPLAALEIEDPFEK